MQLQKNITLPEDHIKLQASNVKAFIGDNECGKGTLSVAESNLVWKQENSDNGFCFEYPNIALHAISNDAQAFPDPCLYLILDKNVSDDEHHDYSSSEENQESENVNEIRFVPEDKQLLKPLFQAMNDCQALYPDKSMSGGEEDDEEEDFDDDDAEGHDDENGHNQEEMEDAVEDENNGSH